MSQRRPVQPLTVAELVRLDPLRAAEVVHLPHPARHVERVVLAETVDRVRRVTPHAVVVLHAEAATGGWSLAAALHLAWERNAAAVVVARQVASVASTALAQRLQMALLLVENDPVDLALDLAGHVTAPAVAMRLKYWSGPRVTPAASITKSIGLTTAHGGKLTKLNTVIQWYCWISS